MELGRARSLAVTLLEDAGIESADLEADLLLVWATGFQRGYIHAHPEKNLTEDQLKTFFEATERRCGREPLQHITKEAGFFGLSLLIEPGALVPRPETEIAVEAALESFRGGLFVDWGTGSGCIAAAILENAPRSFCVAVEQSPGAIRIAWRNFKKLGQISRVLLWHGSDPWQVPLKARSASLLISNPPYIPDSVIPLLMPEVRLHDPLGALSGGSDGLDAYRILLPWAWHVLETGGTLVLETGGKEQCERVEMLGAFGFRREKTLCDFSGIARVLVLKKE